MISYRILNNHTIFIIMKSIHICVDKSFLKQQVCSKIGMIDRLCIVKCVIALNLFKSSDIMQHPCEPCHICLIFIKL